MLVVRIIGFNSAQERRCLVENMVENRATESLQFNFLLAKWEK